MKANNLLHALLFLVTLSLCAISYAAVHEKYRIHLKQRSFTPAASANVISFLGAEKSVAGKYVLLQFHDMPPVSMLNDLGVQPLQYLSPTTIAANIENANVIELIPLVRWSGKLQAQDKFSKAAKSALSKPNTDPHMLLVEMYPDVSSKEILKLINILDGTIIAHPDIPENVNLVKGSVGMFHALAEESIVNWISIPPNALLSGQSIQYCAGPITPYGNVANYATFGDGWDGPGQGSVTLKYYFTNGTSDLIDNQEQEIVRQALTEWAKYVDIEFLPAEAPGEPISIDFSWLTGAHGDPLPFDGPGNMLAHGFFPAPLNSEPLAGDLHFDDDETWTTQPPIDWLNSTEKHLFTVALHEIGHALGVNHSDEQGAVMNAIYTGSFTKLHQDDISAIQSLYAPINRPIGCSTNTSSDNHIDPSMPLVMLGSISLIWIRPRRFLRK